jgi:pimeloyl-ACP methyl ester carboxylesterase
MSEFIPWDSQSREEWADRYASGSFMDLDGIPTHYVERGAGEPLILLHGFFFDAEMWGKNIDALAAVYKVYAIDLWGFGYSSRARLEYDYPLYADQLLKFMDALDIKKAALLGQSMGGGTIIRFTVSHPDRVNKIVLVNAAGLPNKLPPIGKISNLPLLGEWMYGLETNGIRKFTLKNNFIHNAQLLTTGFFDRLTRFHKIRGSSEVMLSVTRKQFFDTLKDDIARLAGMDIPALIVWGGNEKTIPLPVGRELHRLLPGSRLEILDRAGHCSNIDQYEEFNRLVLEFLSAGVT